MVACYTHLLRKTFICTPTQTPIIMYKIPGSRRLKLKHTHKYIWIRPHRQAAQLHSHREHGERRFIHAGALCGVLLSVCLSPARLETCWCATMSLSSLKRERELTVVKKRDVSRAEFIFAITCSMESEREDSNCLMHIQLTPLAVSVSSNAVISCADTTPVNKKNK